MKEFIAIEGSTIFDVCLNTYGTLNRIVKLMDDSGHAGGITAYPTAGQVFLYDENLVNVQSNQNLNQNYTVAAGASVKKYATKQ